MKRCKSHRSSRGFDKSRLACRRCRNAPMRRSSTAQRCAWKASPPWLAGIDPAPGAPRRRRARRSEIPQESRPLVDHLVEQRLLATDLAAGTGETTIEPAHEALLRQWSLLQGWLTEDAGLLSVMDTVARAAKDWHDHNRSAIWLTHATGRLAAAEQVLQRPDLAASFGQRDRDYLAACREAERVAHEKE